VRYVDAQGLFVGYSNPNLVGGAFVHVVATYDLGTSSLWVDGVLAESVSDPRPLTDPSGTFLWGNSNSEDAPFVGDLDELAVYGTALTESQVLAHLAAGRGQ
jgi:hypothetical protein